MRLKTYLLSGAKLSTIPQRNEASIGYEFTGNSSAAIWVYL